MSEVFVDGWAIGVDERWGFDAACNKGWNAHPLDFTVAADTEREEVLSVDVRYVNGERTAIPMAEHHYPPQFISDGYRHDKLKPIEIVQPQGGSFQVNSNKLSWAGYKMHIGFSYHEGIVISDVRMHDPYEGRHRTLFNRISVVEVVVPYGCPNAPHHKKHAFDLGKYGSGYMTNSLKLGCDCKGAIHCVSAHDRKLIISQIITAPAISAQNHQHLLSLYVDPEVDGRNNTVVQSDAVQSKQHLGSNLRGGPRRVEEEFLRTGVERLELSQVVHGRDPGEGDGSA
ncbi:copper amine oxidase [Aspergillus insuetus]